MTLALTLLIPLLAGCQMPGDVGEPRPMAASRFADISRLFGTPPASGNGPAGNAVEKRVEPAMFQASAAFASVAPARYQEIDPASGIRRDGRLLKGGRRASGIPTSSNLPAPDPIGESPLPLKFGAPPPADPMAPTEPGPATERVLALTAELMVMRRELTDLQQTVARIEQENRELRTVRDELSTRLTNLEQELQGARARELQVRGQFDDMNRRMQQYYSRRQEQIAELNRFIDLLERQLQNPRQTGPENGVNPIRGTDTAIR